MVSADAKFNEITKNGIEAKQITRLPTREMVIKLKKHLESVPIGKLDEALLEALFLDDFALGL